MKSAVWLSKGPETTKLKRELLRDGYRIVDSLRVRSEHTYPKTIELLVRISPR
jgi:hypothetical protein